MGLSEQRLGYLLRHAAQATLIQPIPELQVVFFEEASHRLAINNSHRHAVPFICSCTDLSFAWMHRCSDNGAIANVFYAPTYITVESSCCIIIAVIVGEGDGGSEWAPGECGRRISSVTPSGLQPRRSVERGGTGRERIKGEEREVSKHVLYAMERWGMKLCLQRSAEVSITILYLKNKNNLNLINFD